LPVTGKILPDAPLASDDAVTLDTTFAPRPNNFARISLLTRTLTQDDGTAQEPTSQSDAAEQEHNIDAPDETPPMAVVLQLLNGLVAQPASVLPSLSGAAASHATQAPTPSLAAPSTTIVAEGGAKPTDASAANTTKALGAVTSQAARAAGIDPRVFGLTLERETQSVRDHASDSDAAAAAVPTDRIVALQVTRAQPLAAQAVMQAVTGNEEPKPQSSAAGLSALARFAGGETKRDDGAQPDQTLALSSALIADGPANVATVVRTVAPAGERIDFAALVESVARARENAAGPQDVAIALTHAEFGKVSLRFQNEDKGLSVSMISPDPGFAPAVAAARMADAADQRPQGQTSQNQGQAPASQSGLTGDGFAGTRGGSSQRQEAQNQGRTQANLHAEPERNAATGDELRRSAIWA
jgi:hypothetical protein